MKRTLTSSTLFLMVRIVSEGSVPVVEASGEASAGAVAATNGVCACDGNPAITTATTRHRSHFVKFIPNPSQNFTTNGRQRPTLSIRCTSLAESRAAKPYCFYCQTLGEFLRGC